MKSITPISLLSMGLLLGVGAASHAQTTAATRNGFEGVTNPVPAGQTPTAGPTDVLTSTIQPAGPRMPNNNSFFNIEGGTMPRLTGTAPNQIDVRSYGLLRFDLAALKSTLATAFGSSLYSFTSIKLILTQSNAAFTLGGFINLYYTSDDTTDIKSSTPFKYPGDGVFYTGNPFVPVQTPTIIPAGKEFLRSYEFVQDAFTFPSNGSGKQDVIEVLTGSKGSSDLALKIVNGTTTTLSIDPDNIANTDPNIAATYEGQTGFFSTNTTTNQNRNLYYAPYIQVTAVAGAAFGGQLKIDALPSVLVGKTPPTATLEFRKVGGGSTIVKNVALSPDLSFYVSGIPAGTYNIGVKTPNTLRRILTNVSTGTGAVALAFPTLLSGDVNNSNTVDVDDLTLLLNAYNTAVPSPQYLPAADFNLSGTVDVDDLTLLLNNYNTTGAMFPAGRARK